MENKNIEIILAAAVEIDGKKKLSCPNAFKLGSTHNIPLKEICDICNQNNIKITNCQLGCFK